jgi:TonB family protein
MKIRSLLVLAACAIWVLGGRQSACAQDVPGGSNTANGRVVDSVPGRLIKRVEPNYPGFALANDVDGDVVMQATITAQGKVTNIKVIHGLPQLINSAVHAVSQWEYEPYRIDGVATPVTTRLVVHFNILKKTPEADAPPQAESSNPPPMPRPILPPPPQGVIRISGRVMESMLDKKVEPIYPTDSIAVDARGMVAVLATIDKSGEVIDAQAVSGPGRFRDAAVDAVKQWRYRPYLVDGEAVSVQTTVTLNFAPPQR